VSCLSLFDLNMNGEKFSESSIRLIRVCSVPSAWQREIPLSDRMKHPTLRHPDMRSARTLSWNASQVVA